jgi:hypothetical protein
MPDAFVWIYNSRTGTVVLNALPFAQLSLKSGLGWHGPFDNKEAAVKYYNDNKAKNPGWIAPTGFFDSVGNVGNIATGTGEAIDNTIQNKLGLSDENIRSWLIRIGEILLGIVLVGVGIAKLTGTTNAVAGLVKAKI